MDLKIDLLKKPKKSLFRIILGILIFLLAIGWIIIRVIKNRSVTPFDWIYSGIFSLNGVFYAIEGLGYSFERFFGKAYILINLECISLKITVYEKEQYINWDEIKSIDYKLNRFEIKKKDNTNMVLNLSRLDYISINEIKKIINDIAKEKNIQASI
jgi:hypothetical protein